MDIPGHHLGAGPDDRPDRSGAAGQVLQVQQAEGQVREGGGPTQHSPEGGPGQQQGKQPRHHTSDRSVTDTENLLITV